MADVTLTANTNASALAALGFTEGAVVNLNGHALTLDADVPGHVRASNAAGVMGPGTLAFAGPGTRTITGNVYPGTGLMLTPVAIAAGTLRIAGTLYGPASANVGLAVPLAGDATIHIDTCVVGGNGSVAIKDVAGAAGPGLLVIGTLLGSAGTGVGLDFSPTQGARVHIGTAQAAGGTGALVVVPGFGAGPAGGWFTGSTIGRVQGGSGGVAAVTHLAAAASQSGGPPPADALVVTTAVGGSAAGSHAIALAHGGLTVVTAVGGTHPEAAGVSATCFGPPNGPQPSTTSLRVDRTQDRAGPGLRLLQGASKLRLGRLASAQILDSDGVTRRAWAPRPAAACGGRMAWLGW